MKMTNQTTVSAAISAVRPADDATAAEETVRLARRAGIDAIRFLHRVVTSETLSSPVQRVRASVALLEVAGLMGTPSAEARSSAAPPGADSNNHDASTTPPPAS